MHLTDWQLIRLRRALLVFHARGRDSEGKKFAWSDVAEAIDLNTGIRVPGETLRKFVQGVKRPDGTYRSQMPDDERLKAYFDFVTAPDVGLFTEKEMEERDFDVQAASRLLDYLDQDFDGARIMPPNTIEGTYLRRDKIGYQTRVTELTFEKPLDDGTIRTSQTIRHYDAHEYDRDTVNPDIQSEAHYRGWAILTPEDNLFLFLKNISNARNLYYFTLASDLSHVSSQRTNYFAMLHHDYPLQVEKSADLKSGSEAVRQIEDNLFIFTQRGH